MGNVVIKVLKIVSTVLVAIVLLLAVLFVGVRIFGVDVYTVLSGSMEETYPTGSLIYVKDVDPADLKEDDVITFRLGGSAIATHRIIELVPDSYDPSVIRFRTKGDSNDTADGTVEFDEVIGQPVFMIPYLGYLAYLIQEPPGSYAAICVALGVLLFVILVDLISDDWKKKHSKQHSTETAGTEEEPLPEAEPICEAPVPEACSVIPAPQSDPIPDPAPDLPEAEPESVPQAQETPETAPEIPEEPVPAPDLPEEEPEPQPVLRRARKAPLPETEEENEPAVPLRRARKTAEAPEEDSAEPPVKLRRAKK